MNMKAHEIIGCEAEKVNEIINYFLLQDLISNYNYTPNEFDYMKLRRFIERTELNPMDGTMFVRRGSLGLEPGLRIEGWIELGKRAGVIETKQVYSENKVTLDAMGQGVFGVEWIETVLVTATGSFTHREYLAECFWVTESWCYMPNRCLGLKSLGQTIRLLTGVYSTIDSSDRDMSAPKTKDQRPLTVITHEATQVQEQTEPEQHSSATVVETTKPTSKTVDAVVETTQPESSKTETVVETEKPPIQVVEMTEPEVTTDKPITAETSVEVVHSVGKGMSLEEILNTNWCDITVTPKFRGDMRTAFGRIQTPAMWLQVRAYIETSVAISEQDRVWALAAIDAYKASKELAYAA